MAELVCETSYSIQKKDSHIALAKMVMMILATMLLYTNVALSLRMKQTLYMITSTSLSDSLRHTCHKTLDIFLMR